MMSERLRDPADVEAELGATVVQAMHRMARHGVMYALDHPGVAASIEQLAQVVAEYGRRVGRNPSVSFTSDAVYVGRRLLRAGRTVYAAARELGEMFAVLGVREVVLGYDVGVDELRALAVALVEAQRGAGTLPALRRVRFRRGATIASEPEAEPERGTAEGAAHDYAQAVVALRRLHEAALAGTPTLSARLRRSAERLVELGRADACLGILHGHAGGHDSAARAVHATLLALRMAAPLSDDPRLLFRLALAGLLLDVGKPRVAGVDATGALRAGMPVLAEHQLAELPAATAASVLALAGLSEGGQITATLAHETWQLLAGLEPYGGGRPASLLARVLACARRYEDERAAADAEQDGVVDHAVTALLATTRHPADRGVLRLLARALGVYPRGTVVELSTGEVAKVVTVPTLVQNHPFPVVEVVIDAHGAPLAAPRRVDLAADRALRIAGVVSFGDDPGPEATAAAAEGGEDRAAAASAPTPRVRPAPAAGFAVGFATELEAARAGEPDGDVPGAPEADLFALDDDGRDGAAVPASGRGAAADRRRAGDSPTRKPPAPVALELAELEGSPRSPRAPRRGEPAAVGVASGPQSAPAPSSPRTLRSQVAPGDAPQAGGGEPGAWGDADGPFIPASALVQPDAPRAAPAPGAGGRVPIAPPVPPDRQPMATVPAPAGRAPVALGPGPRREAAAASPGASSARKGKPEVTAQGTLERTPLVHQLVYGLDQRLTGSTLLVSPEGGRCAIYFQDGLPSKVRTWQTVWPLDRTLVDMGLVGERELMTSLRAVSQSGALHGRYLVEHGLLDEESLRLALTRQLELKLQFMLALPAASRYAYYAEANVIEAYGGPELTPCQPMPLIMAGVRLRGGDPAVEQALARLGNHRLALHPEADPDAFDLGGDEAQIVAALLADPVPLSALLARRVAPDAVVRATIYALVITRQLELGAGGRPPLVVHVEGLPRRFAPPRPVRTPARAGVAPAPPARAHAAPPGPTASQVPPAPSRPGEPAVAVRGAATAPEPRRGEARAAVPPPPRSQPSAESAPDVAPARSIGSEPPPRRGSSTAPTPPRGAVAAPPDASGSSASPRPPAAVAAREPPSRSPVPARSDPPPDGALTTAPASRRPAGVRVASTADAPRRGTSSAAGVPAARSSSPGGGSSDGLTRELIEQRVAAIEDETYFAMLGVAPESTSTEVQNAYYALARIWHPDRVPPHLVEMRSRVAKVFARLNEAFHTLSDPNKRDNYVRLVASGGGTAREKEMVARVVDSALEFQKAEVLFKRGQVGMAEALVEQAVAADPDQPEYLTLLAWIQAQRIGQPAPTASDADRAAHYAPQLQMLDKVLDKEPRYERALYYRGQLLKQSGQLERAVRDFRAAVALNPRNIDAAREVRLHDMRKERDGGGPGGAQGGLFGRLFGKKAEPPPKRGR
ncbi:MAG: DnaJ domain-containing protein [Polyangiaceae bacterium]|nr:DnaJ domain-containing protein [Polyangiaceae bacterium]